MLLDRTGIPPRQWHGAPAFQQVLAAMFHRARRLRTHRLRPPARVRRTLRRFYHGRGAPGYTGERMRYAPWAGIIRESTLADVETVARAAGYHPAKHGSEPGRMLLLPAGAGAEGA